MGRKVIDVSHVLHTEGPALDEWHLFLHCLDEGVDEDGPSFSYSLWGPYRAAQSLGFSDYAAWWGVHAPTFWAHLTTLPSPPLDSRPWQIACFESAGRLP